MCDLCGIHGWVNELYDGKPSQPRTTPSWVDKATVKEFQNRHGYTRFVCRECGWGGPWWRDGEAAGRDGVHHYGAVHPRVDNPTATEGN